MEIQILKQEYKDAIKKDVYLKAELAAVNKVSTWTVDRWRTYDNPLLTTATNISILRKRLKVPAKISLTEPVMVEEKEVELNEHVSVGLVG